MTKEESALAKQKMICPNCDAEICVEGNKRYVQCVYCGAQIETEQIVEVRYVREADRFERLMEDGEVYYKLKDYYRAEHKFRDAIEKYPDEITAYERLVQVLTRDSTVFAKEDEEDVYEALEHMKRLSQPAQIPYYDDLKQQMQKAFWEEKKQNDEEQRIVNANRKQEQKENVFLIKNMIVAMLGMTGVMFLTLDYDIGGPIGWSFIVLAVILACSLGKDREK